MRQPVGAPVQLRVAEAAIPRHHRHRIRRPRHLRLEQRREGRRRGCSGPQVPTVEKLATLGRCHDRELADRLIRSSSDRLDQAQETLLVLLQRRRVVVFPVSVEIDANVGILPADMTVIRKSSTREFPR